MGITFNVYGDNAGTERIFPSTSFHASLKRRMGRGRRGLKQRIEALNLFSTTSTIARRFSRISVPEEIIRSAKSYRAACAGFDPPQGIWCHITGTDLVRGGDGQLYVLEDNLRCPSGVSYVLENRQVMKRTFPQVFEASSRVRPVDYYASRCWTIRTRSLRGCLHPSAVLTPGACNPPTEHSSSSTNGCGVAEGRDLVRSEGFVPADDEGIRAHRRSLSTADDGSSIRSSGRIRYWCSGADGGLPERTHCPGERARNRNRRR
jgi:uncharacterized circularly permuted ATP-grasp superfamily protein